MPQSVEIFVSYRLVNTLHKPNIWEDMAIDNIVSLCCRTCQTYEKIWPWTISCPFVVALMLCSSPCLLLKNMFMLLISMKRETKRKANKKQPSRKLRCDGNTIVYQGCTIILGINIWAHVLLCNVSFFNYLSITPCVLGCFL